MKATVKGGKKTERPEVSSWSNIGWYKQNQNLVYNIFSSSCSECQNTPQAVGCSGFLPVEICTGELYSLSHLNTPHFYDINENVTMLKKAREDSWIHTNSFLGLLVLHPSSCGNLFSSFCAILPTIQPTVKQTCTGENITSSSRLQENTFVM